MEIPSNLNLARVYYDITYSFLSPSSSWVPASQSSRLFLQYSEAN